jgi:hypothetical protein
VSTNSFREFKVDNWEVLALDMGNGNLIACLCTYKHCEVVDHSGTRHKKQDQLPGNAASGGGSTSEDMHE